MLSFIAGGITHSFGLYLIPVTEYLEVGRETFGFAFALQGFIAGAGAFIFGAISDKYGSGIASFIGAILFIVGLVLFANVGSSTDIIISQCMIGFGASGTGVSVTLGAVGRVATDKNRTLYLGVVMAGASAGQFIILPISSFLLQTFDWSQSLIYLAILSSSMLFFAFALNFSSKSKSSIEGTNQSIKEALIEALYSKSFILLTIGFFVCGFHVTFVAVHLPAYISDQNLPSWVGGWALALIGLFNIVGSLLFGYFGDNVSTKTLLAFLYTLR